MTKANTRTTRKNNIMKIAEAESATEYQVDRLGLRIDNRIFDSVVALRVHGFDTKASCEGHMRWGEPAPWMDIGVVASQTIPKDTKPLLQSNLHAQKRMIELLDRFHRLHFASDSVRIIVVPVGIFGGFRITNQAANIQRLFPVKSRRGKLLQFQNEFRAFAKFLKGTLP